MSWLDWLAKRRAVRLLPLHLPWLIPTALLDTFLMAYPAKRYRSAPIIIAVRSAQSVVLLGLTLSLVLEG